ncbi:MAG: ABC transporter ATP-binding protein [Firmicutes bacterium]|nr:ABC transporter ATP-binding protein [Bacillota bacterium]
MNTIYEVSNLTYKYPSGDRMVLDGASLRLGEGEILCILGPNGAGKTTLLNCLAGLIKPKNGEIKLKGRSINDMKVKDIAQIVGYVPQVHTPAFDYKVKDFVLMGASPGMGMFERPSKEDEEACIKVLAGMNLEHLAEKSYMNISGGERQQVLIARAILQKPSVILFDEPTAHLDYGNQHRVLKRIKKMSEDGYSVIITTHNPDHSLLLGGNVAIVGRDGKIIQGKCEEMITEENLRKVYDIDLRLMWVEELGRKVCLVPEL